MAAGAGRPRIASELGLTDHQARRLVQEIRRPPLSRPRDDHHPQQQTTTHEIRDGHTEAVSDDYHSRQCRGPEPPAADEQG